MEYKFAEEQKTNEDGTPITVQEKIIEKRGLVIKFNFLELEADKLKFEKALKELKGNRDLKQSVVDNMDIHHPFIKDMSEFDRYSVHMYQEAFAAVKAYNTKIDEIEKEQIKYLEELEDIKNQIPQLAEVVSPMQVVGGEVKETEVKTNEKGEETTE